MIQTVMLGNFKSQVR